MKHQVFFITLFFSFSAYSMQHDDGRMLNRHEVAINLNAYTAYLKQFSHFIEISLVQTEVELIKNKYPSGSSLQNIIEEISKLPCPIYVGDRVILLESKNERIKKTY